ncbi:hypothetical protein ABT034_17720 [Streptomyces sp. NPDC002773]|uniref:RICIN domain-containing protein n=1 Tax=Streptomyces sp. NPDC002773 TaxID=3154430 RepID=UPI00332D45C4
MSARSRIRRAARYLCAVTLGAAATLGAAPQASAAVPSGYYRIVTYEGLCWDDGGAQLTQWTCEEDNEDQVFYLMPSYDHVEQRVQTADGKCLEADGFYEHDSIRGQRCDWDSYDQLFRFVPLGNGTYQIRTDSHAGKCAHVEYPGAGVDVTSSPCWNSEFAEKQKFELVPVS